MVSDVSEGKEWTERVVTAVTVAKVAMNPHTSNSLGSDASTAGPQGQNIPRVFQNMLNTKTQASSVPLPFEQLPLGGLAGLTVQYTAWTESLYRTTANFIVAVIAWMMVFRIRKHRRSLLR
jgi:hypothetical protein